MTAYVITVDSDKVWSIHNSSDLANKELLLAKIVNRRCRIQNLDIAFSIDRNGRLNKE